MKLTEVMTTHVRGISGNQSVQEAAEAMSQLSIGAVPVFGDGQPIGIVTDRDIAIRAVAAGLDCSRTPTSDIMSGDLCTVPEATSIEDVVHIMEERQIRRVLVTGGENGEIVGIVSVGDIAAKSHQQGLSAELIEKVSLPCEPTREAVQ